VRELRTQYIEGIYDNPVTLKSKLRVTQDHWKRNHWVDDIRLTIFDVEYYHDLKMWVRGHSRSLKMARFDRPCMTFYRSTIETIALSCTVFELFDVE